MGLVSNSTLELINTVAQSLGAIGTLAAVIVALYLARRQTSEQISIRTAKIGIVRQGLPGSHEGFFLQIAITNVGLRDVTITSFGWQIAGRPRVHFFQSLPMSTLSSTLPKKLAPSETATFVYPWDDFIAKAGPLRRAFGRGPFGRAVAQMTKCVVCLSSGVVARATIDSHVANELFKASLSDSPSPPSTASKPM